YWWDYRAVDYGDSVLEVTYTDLHGETKTYQFTLHVKTDVYGVDIFTGDGSFFALPGETLYLHAEAWHESETDGSTDSVTYQWEIAWGGGAELTPDSEDPSRAYLTFRNLEEGEEWAEEHVQVRVCIFDGEDEHGEPAEQSRNEAHFVMRSEYAEIWPAENNTLLGPGETEVINAHVRNYIGDPESYEIQPDVHYRWYYDSNIIEVYDRDGMLVGNNNASGEYIDSEASYGAETEFTILKKENVHTMVTLIAEWEVGRGEYRQERKDYWYHEADLSLKEIGLSEPSITIGVGEAYTLNVIYVPENTTDDRSVEWISSDSRIVSVHDGTVRGISSGTAVVIAKVGVFTASCTVTVGKKAEEILLNTYDATLNRGDSFQLTAEIIPEDVTNKKVYWSSSTPETATVDDHGLVRAIAPGVAEITVVSEDNPEAYTTCKILVQFTDVTDPSLFYYDYIYSMVEKGITTGYPDGTFRPTADCNRAAVVTFLWRLKGKPEPTQMATFKDMTGNSDFDKAISWAAENNITTGWTDNTFRPWNTCNRAAVMTFLWRAAGKPAPNKMAEFKDMTGNSDFDTAISWASEKGITTGWADNTFRPWNTCNRLAIASFLGRYAALEETIIETNR
ncbi:MAG: S-layer homology domain-containing protein, partial [Solobacterium sp.]|nr:S-layer homology domain-containing protein [Solobacterium sp.]